MSNPVPTETPNVVIEDPSVRKVNGGVLGAIIAVVLAAIAGLVAWLGNAGG